MDAQIRHRLRTGTGSEPVYARCLGNTSRRGACPLVETMPRIHPQTAIQTTQGQRLAAGPLGESTPHFVHFARLFCPLSGEAATDCRETTCGGAGACSRDEGGGDENSCPPRKSIAKADKNPLSRKAGKGSCRQAAHREHATRRARWRTQFGRLLLRLDRRLGGGQPGDRHAVGRAAHVVQPGLEAELDRGRVAALLAADADLQVAARRAALARPPS